ncbi:hypothetical protein [Leptothoe spongobia]|uniref:Uncharacterized protein n=1 Tax=Leptothoe spongobia TAU-MAC 1115 TaxID=1967444 RepID=A0A947GR10_9CYAN|nr:hypothetical protein [Leptothoe spongobia]MBT9317306.1 hypothetical protein [Leptothoe spongobia TAU-MAC 1115]
MALTIEITPELEHQIKQAAERAGLTPDTYVLQLLHQSLQQQAPKKAIEAQLPKEQADLIQIINQSFSDIEWQRYHSLIGKRDSETLTPEEHEDLVTLSDQLEEANAERIQAVADLAKLRCMSVNALMPELDLQPIVHACVETF